MKIVNLTPHALSLHGAEGVLTVTPSGTLARLEVSRVELTPLVIDGVELSINRPTLGAVINLPSPEAGVIYVVSALVAEAAGREDVYSPGELVRDAEGRPIGAKGLCSYQIGGAA